MGQYRFLEDVKPQNPHVLLEAEQAGTTGSVEIAVDRATWLKVWEMVEDGDDVNFSFLVENEGWWLGSLDDIDERYFGYLYVDLT